MDGLAREAHEETREALEEKGGAVGDSGYPMTSVPAEDPSPDSFPGGRVALVAATGSYADPGLGGLPGAADAELMAGVLEDPAVGGFAVTRMVDGGEREVKERVEEFLGGRGRGDTVVVYLSCHGVLDRRGRLYFAAADTEVARLASTGVGAGWLLARLDDCAAERQVVILDCCYSGAFARSGSKGAAGAGERAGQELARDGRGRAVLTASRSTEQSWVGDADGAAGRASVFTRFLAQGLRTGAADTDGDGRISVDEAYYYAYEEVMVAGAGQNPQLYITGGEGTVWLVLNPTNPNRTAPLAEDPPVPAFRPPPGSLTPDLPRRRRRIRLALGASAVAVAGLIAALTTLNGPSSSPPRAQGTAPAVLYGFSAPVAIAADGSHLWVANGNSMTELNAADGAQVRTLSDFSFPSSIAVEGSHLWVANGGGLSVTELNTADGSQVRSLAASQYSIYNPVAIAADSVHVWIAEGAYDAVTEVNSADGSLVAVLSPLRYGFAGLDAIAVGGGHVWVANYDGSSVTELDAADGSKVNTLPSSSYFFDGPDAIAVDGADVWVANAAGNSVTELDAADGRWVRTLSGPGYSFDGPDAIAADGAHVWVANGDGNSVTELNASNGIPVRVLSAKGYHLSEPAAIAVDDGHVWVANKGGDSVTELPAG